MSPAGPSQSCPPQLLGRPTGAAAAFALSLSLSLSLCRQRQYIVCDGQQGWIFFRIFSLIHAKTYLTWCSQRQRNNEHLSIAQWAMKKYVVLYHVFWLELVNGTTDINQNNNTLAACYRAISLLGRLYTTLKMFLQTHLSLTRSRYCRWCAIR